MNKLSVLLALPLLGAPCAAATHTVVPGDHLWGLAGHYYTNHFRWQVIHAANQDKIKDPHWIYPGQILTIPDVPSAEIGELPARPLPSEKKEAAVTPAGPVEAQEVAEESAPEAPAPKAAVTAKAAAVAVPLPAEDLSAKMPKSFSGQYPSMTRYAAPKDWKDDGSITEFDGREMIAAAGDSIFAKMKSAPQDGELYDVYRKTAPQEQDADPKATFLQPVGRLQMKGPGPKKGQYRFLILKSADTVQVGDVLKKVGAP